MIAPPSLPGVVRGFRVAILLFAAAATVLSEMFDATLVATPAP